jgi:hypothetical protein
VDFSKISDEFAQEIVREGEAYLSGQVQIATSADQRAAVMASVFAAAGAALMAGVLTAASGQFTNEAASLLIGGTAAAILFLVGASFCVRATMPQTFWVAGAEPENWESDVAAGRPLKDALGEQAGNIQEKIDENNATLMRNAWWFKWGGRFGIAAPFAGLMLWLMFLICRTLGEATLSF